MHHNDKREGLLVVVAARNVEFVGSGSRCVAIKALFETRPCRQTDGRGFRKGRAQGVKEDYIKAPQ